MATKRVDKTAEEVSKVRRATDGSDASFALVSSALESRSLSLRLAGTVSARLSADDRFVPLLAKRFTEVCDDEQLDPTAELKTELLFALSELGSHDVERYRFASTLVQLVNRGSDEEYDVADRIRAIATVGFTACGLNREDTVRAVLPMLFDQYPSVRAAAMQALGNVGGWDVEVLLESRFRTHERVPYVTGECLRALLARNPDRYIPFALAGIPKEHNDGLLEIVSALGDCRDERGAVGLITALGNTTLIEDQRVQIYGVLGRSRHPAAVDFLLAKARDDSDAEERGRAVDALRAGIHASRLTEL